jgi:GNAT superfamily N-acetyltransferase
MSLNIRAATAADVAVVADLIRQLADFEKLSHEVVLTEEGLARWMFGDHAYCEAVIAEEAGEAVGFALFFHTFSTFLGRPGLYLEDLFVRPEHRGSGLGKALLRHLARLAVDRGCGRFEWAVLDWNESAIRFYESLGARPNAGWTVYRLAGDALSSLADS